MSSLHKIFINKKLPVFVYTLAGFKPILILKRLSSCGNTLFIRPDIKGPEAGS
jgi:hypothetical protein